MSLIRIYCFFLILTVCTVLCINAAEDESPITTLRSPNKLSSIHNNFPHQSPLRSSPSKVSRQTKVFKRDTPFQAHELEQLLDSDYTQIYLTGIYVGHRTSEGFVPLPKSSLTISPETINPDVEILSLSGCGLSDADLEGISRFKKLRKVNLDGNRIGDGCIPYITGIEGLESLSIAVT
jgi:Leucine-rich repeat (LRR) protein